MTETIITTSEDKTMKNNRRCIWYDGKDVYEVSFCNEFLEEHPMKFVDGKFYNTDGAVDIQTVRKMISDKLLKEQVQKDFAKRVNALTGALQSICYAPDFEGNVPVRFILDDFATNVYIPDFDKIISVIRSREISVSIVHIKAVDTGAKKEERTIFGGVQG